MCVCVKNIQQLCTTICPILLSDPKTWFIDYCYYYCYSSSSFFCRSVLLWSVHILWKCAKFMFVNISKRIFCVEIIFFLASWFGQYETKLHPHPHPHTHIPKKKLHSLVVCRKCILSQRQTARACE